MKRTKVVLMALLLVAASAVAKAESMTVPVSIDGRTVKYVVLFFESPFKGKRTIVAVTGGKIKIPGDFSGFRGYCLSDREKKVVKCARR